MTGNTFLKIETHQKIERKMTELWKLQSKQMGAADLKNKVKGGCVFVCACAVHVRMCIVNLWYIYMNGVCLV